MRRIVYTSHATRALTPLDLESILTSARRYNQRHDITGMLIFHDGAFLQVLEGNNAAVSVCYDRIQKDRRHAGCIRMMDEACGSRIFDNWQMAYEPFGSLGSPQQRQFLRLGQVSKQAQEVALQSSPAISTMLMAFLTGFRRADLAV